MCSLSNLLCDCTWPDSNKLQSKRIDVELKKQKKKLRREISVLLLGTGESGKSTFLKQMVIIHGRGEFTVDEIYEYKLLIFANILNGMRILIAARKFFDDIVWQYPEQSANLSQQFAKLCPAEFSAQRLNVAETFTKCAPLVTELWNDSAIRETFERRREFQLPDSCKYFFENIARISQASYAPSNRDILLCRKATRAITEHVFDIQNVPFRFIDVGGQRSQRQKWFECFEGVTSILFLVASNEYDQVLLEDRRKNRLLESREVYDTIVNNRFFSDISFILFFNKTDLLSEKITRSDIRDNFENFQGNPHSLHDVQFFFLGLFDSVRKNKAQPFFYHFTTAIDTDNIRRVFKDCKEIILDRNLKTLMMHGTLDTECNKKVVCIMPLSRLDFIRLLEILSISAFWSTCSDCGRLKVFSVISRLKRICLFDVDGTLTRPRQKIDNDFLEYLRSLSKKIPLAVVGGSDIDKVLEQLDLNLKDACDLFEYVFAENGLFVAKKNQQFPTATIQEVIGEEKLQEFINYCLHYLSEVKLPVKRGNFIEFRKGMLNVSPIGRSCSQNERNEFVEYDEKHQIREKFIEELRKRFPVEKYGLHFSIGGQISIDVFPVGWDKRYCLQFLEKDDFREIYFFGDRTFPGGNDYEIFEDPRTIGHRVTSPKDTERELKSLFG
ncbi:Guanine nucleotide-binding protein alpha-12 subunit [Trichinella britovi]|uniref:phosphomannomutase n=2 Tax=Trichinella britovi TaxID=45882 RepID=A0A0V1DFD1_TRIBR|nr:Guanine nucleotide-binding protein alpha-12 subunit [Trichinella britovi]